MIDYDQEATFILTSTGIRVDTEECTSPIQIRSILKRFGLIYRDFTFDDENMDAMYVPALGKHFVYVDESRAFNRRRFSMGHEFGHFYFRHPFDPGRPRAHWIEIEANKLAAALLMPLNPFVTLHKSLSTIKEIASWFRVSEIAAAFRMRDLGLRPEERELVISDYYIESGDGQFLEASISQI